MAVGGAVPDLAVLVWLAAMVVMGIAMEAPELPCVGVQTRSQIMTGRVVIRFRLLFEFSTCL